MTASVIIFARVAAGREDDFLAWEQDVEATMRTFEGFLGQRVERPVEQGSDEWTVIIAFDTEEQLETWLVSPERRRLLARAEELQEHVRLERTSYGFGFWSGEQGKGGRQPHRIFKDNLLVLVVLYPTIILWGYAVGTPLFTNALHWPFWAALFVGNLASTQLLGWFLVPWAMRAFRRWLEPDPGWRVQLLGYAIVVALCAAFMGLYAWLIALFGYV
ncbi:MAG: antibiotic biosynthesis monooxygenase [Microbacterium sp.]|nr:antibiotic biosynthesis monooxygenase [Microbacterium sp.]